MKWIVGNAIALFAAIAVFGGSVTYAATCIKEVEPPQVVSFNDDNYDYKGEATAADLLFPNSSEQIVQSSELSPLSSELPSSKPPSSVLASSAPSSQTSSKASSNIVPPKPSSVQASSELPSSKPSSELSSEPPSSEPISSEAPSSEISSEVSSAPITGPVDEYMVDLIAGAVQREIVGVNTAPQQRYYEAYKAQAVACHTYMKFHQKSDGSFPTMSYTTPHPQTTQLVREVVNQLVYYNGQVINASYHAASGGATQAATYVWGNPIPYLVGVPSSYDDYQGSYTITSSEMERLLMARGIAVSGDPSTWFNLASATYSDGGFIDYIPICGQNVRGRTLRENILGSGNLKSCKILSINYDGTSFTFVTNGFGHGVGLSQIGSLGYAANEGWNYVQILQHYYPGTTVS